MPLCATVFSLSMNAVTTSGLPEITGGRGRVSVHIDLTVALAESPVNGLVFHSAYNRRMNAPRFNDFSAQTRQNLDPYEKVIFIYDQCASSSRSRHPRGQYRAGDAPGLQPIPEHSGAANQLTEGSDKRRRIEARNTGSNG